MITVVIPQKMSGTGTIHDLASDLYDRKIKFRKGTEFAVVWAAFYGGKGYKTFASTEAALKYYFKYDLSGRIIDNKGRVYCTPNKHEIALDYDPEWGVCSK